MYQILCSSGYQIRVYAPGGTDRNAAQCAVGGPELELLMCGTYCECRLFLAGFGVVTLM